MKKTILFSVVVLSLVGAVSFGAHTSGGVTVDVPFTFVAGGENLPAGHYSMERVFGGGQAILVIRNSEGEVVQTALGTSGVAGASTPAVEFIKSGTSHVLAAVKTQTSVFHLARAHETAKKLQLAAN